ncbi:MAG TPA: hypothetical protein ENI85_08500 [Deltaproteobacteria bacterium]|nr:hypothetical protein [Deltaproteobacteria bacterium]
MIPFIGFTGLVSLVVGWSITLHLHALARRTGALPERLLAIAFGGMFCLGFPLAGMSRVPALVGTPMGSGLFIAGLFSMVIGLRALNRFPEVVFRPGRRWARFVRITTTIVGSLSGIGCAVSVAKAGSREEMIESIQPWAIGLMFSILVPFLWNGVESSLYYRAMQRRLAIGLAEPETTHRFLLWALASWGSVAHITAILVIRASGLPIIAPLPMTIIATSSLVTSVCWWLAFLMPDSYRTRILGDRTDPESPRG